MYKSFKIRLEPNNKQKNLFVQHAGVARHAYNQGLEYCNNLYQTTKKIPSSIELHKWLVAEVKSKNLWYYKLSKCPPQEALRNLEKAFKNFHKTQKKHNYTLKDKKGRPLGLPKFKKKGVKDSFYLEYARGIAIANSTINLPIIGLVKLSETFPDTKVKNCVVSRKANHWFVSFRIEYTPAITPKKFDTVGVDLGIKTLATLSNGETFPNIRAYKKEKSKLRKQQKEVSRRFVRGAENQSANYKKSVLKLSKTHASVGYARQDALHKLTTYLAKNFETVVIEDLAVRNMVKNHNLASAILDGGFFEFKRQLLYKKSWYGGEVIVADRFFASSKTCSCCGVKKKDLKLSERTFICDSCGFTADRDLNASLNLERYAVSSTV